jgi:hypothetical protein
VLREGSVIRCLDECDLSEGSSELARWQYPASQQVTETKRINPSREGHSSSSGKEFLDDTDKPTVFSEVREASLSRFAGHQSISSMCSQSRHGMFNGIRSIA